MIFTPPLAGTTSWQTQQAASSKSSLHLRRDKNSAKAIRFRTRHSGLATIHSPPEISAHPRGVISTAARSAAKGGVEKPAVASRISAGKLRSFPNCDIHSLPRSHLYLSVSFRPQPAAQRRAEWRNLQLFSVGADELTYFRMPTIRRVAPVSTTFPTTTGCPRSLALGDRGGIF